MVWAFRRWSEGAEKIGAWHSSRKRLSLPMGGAEIIYYRCSGTSTPWRLTFAFFWLITSLPALGVGTGVSFGSKHFGP